MSIRFIFFVLIYFSFFLLNSCNSDQLITSNTPVGKSEKEQKIRQITENEKFTFNAKALSNKVENNNPLLNYSGNWVTTQNNLASGGSFVVPTPLGRINQGSSLLTYSAGWNQYSGPNNTMYRMASSISDIILSENNSGATGLIYSASNWNTTLPYLHTYNSGTSNSMVYGLTSSSVIYNGTGWLNQTVNGSSVKSQNNGTFGETSVRANFSGSDLSLGMVKGPDRGIVKISVYDSVNNLITEKTEDLYDPTTKFNFVDFNLTTEGSYYLLIEPTGNKNPASSANKYDFFRLVIYPQKVKSITLNNPIYTGNNWSAGASTTNGFYMHTGTGLTDIKFSFTGTNISIGMITGNNRGIVEVSVYDQSNNLVKKVETDLYSTLFENAFVNINGLKEANYNVVIKPTGNKNTASTGYRYNFTKAIIFPYIEYSFSGSSIQYLARKLSSGGIVRITLDGDSSKATLIDLYSLTTINETVKTFAGLSNSNHRITIEATGEKNSSSSGYVISLDKFKTMVNVSGSFTGTDFVITSFRNNNYGMMDLYLDGEFKETIDLYAPTMNLEFVSVLKNLSNQNHNFTLMMNPNKNPSSSGNSINISYFFTEIPRVSYTFTSTGIFVMARAAANQGKMLVSVTGLDPIEVDIYDPNTVWQDNALQLDGFTEGVSKTITIESAFKKNDSASGYGINFDAFVEISAPKIFAIYPTAGKAGDTVLVGGKNFSLVPQENVVIFNSSSGNPVQAQVVSAADDELKVIVPDTAVSSFIGVETPGGFIVSQDIYGIMDNIPFDSSSNASQTSASSQFGKVAANNYGKPMVIWEDKSNQNLVFDLFYTQWENNFWFNSLINITNSSGSGLPAKNASIVFDNNGNRHMVFHKGDALFYTMSADGATWTFPAMELTKVTNSNPNPKLAFGTKKLHLVWVDYNEILYTNSSSGNQWTDVENISSSPLASINPAIAADSRDIPYVVWQDNSGTNTNYQVYYKRRPASGWSSLQKISTDDSLPATNPGISVDGQGRPAIVWEQPVSGFKDIFFSKNNNREVTSAWTTPINISNSENKNTVNPVISSDTAGFSYSTWQESDFTIKFSKQTDKTNNTWSTPEQLSATGKISRYPNMTMDYRRNAMHIVWESNEQNNLYDIHYTLKQCNPPEATNNRLAIMETNKGTIKMILLEKEMPLTTKNFINLVNSGFYNGLTFHRYEAGFVVQGGDPTGTGSGGSNQQINLENNRTLKFDKAGVVGMARTSDPDSANSQFFFTLDQAMSLNGDYAVFAVVYSGLDKVKSLRQGDTINSVTIVNP